MTHTPSKKSTRHRGLHLSRTQRKALRRRSQNALRYWRFLTRCFTSLRRRPAFRWIRAFKRLRTAFGALALACWLPTLSQADTFTVTIPSDTSVEDDGALTLREAITLANENDGPDTIDFTGELSGAVIKLTQGELAISDDLSIDASSLAEAPIIDADEKSRVMHFTEPEGDLVLTKLTLQNGKIAAPEAKGGGILFSSSGSLTLNNSTVSRNSGTGYSFFTGYSSGGGIYAGSGAVTLNGSTLSGNSAFNGAGGIVTDSGVITVNNSTLKGNSGGYGGAILVRRGKVILNHSTLSGNSGGYGGGICLWSEEATLNNSTLSGNEASHGTGGGISGGSGAVTLTNSTLSGNSARNDGGGIRVGSGAITLTSSTISGNSTRSKGGGIAGGYGALNLSNSIIAGNWDDGTAPDLFTASDARFDPSVKLEVSYCLIGNSAGADLDEAKLNENNLIDLDPLLVPLASNGGPTQTHALGIGSPAIDQGKATGTDQRGVARVDNPDVPNAGDGNGSDIGAFERTIPLIVSEPGDVSDGDFSAGKVSLREALTLANENDGPDIINFADDLSGAVITLTQGELAISDDLSIDASSLAEAPIIDADEKSRVIHFTAPKGDLSLSKLTLRNGKPTGEERNGGGILFTSSGTFTLNNSTVSGNSTGSYSVGGGIHSGAGAITLNHSVISENSTGPYSAGGGIHSRAGSITLNHSVVRSNSGGYEGGIYTSSGAVTLTNSTVSGNSGLYGGGIRASSGALTLTNSTISGNWGGGIETWGGAITLTNSTISGNSGLYGGGILTDSGAVTLTSSTISGNSSRRNKGGGIGAGDGSLSLRNSIIAGNSDNGTAPDIKAPDDPAAKLEVSHSLIGNSTGLRLDEAAVNESNLIDVDPLLAPLADNGGPTQTMLPYPESPVINAGAPTGHTADQRGLVHTGAPDIGAVEFQGAPDLRRVLSLDHDGDGSSYQLEKAMGTNPFVADPSDFRLLQRPTFNAAGQAVLSFGISETALPGTHWILERTTDLRTFEPIHRFDGTNHLTYEGRPVTITETDTGVSVVDEAPPAGRVFYRLRVVMAE